MGVIKNNFGKHILTETKIKHHHNKDTLKYGDEGWKFRERDTGRLGAAQMRFLQRLLGVTRLSSLRHTDISKRN